MPGLGASTAFYAKKYELYIPGGARSRPAVALPLVSHFDTLRSPDAPPGDRVKYRGLSITNVRHLSRRRGRFCAVSPPHTRVDRVARCCCAPPLFSYDSSPWGRIRGGRPLQPDRWGRCRPFRPRLVPALRRLDFRAWRVGSGGHLVGPRSRRSPCPCRPCGSSVRGEVATGAAPGRPPSVGGAQFPVRPSRRSPICRVQKGRHAEHSRAWVYTGGGPSGPP